MQNFNYVAALPVLFDQIVLMRPATYITWIYSFDVLSHALGIAWCLFKVQY